MQTLTRNGSAAGLLIFEVLRLHGRLIAAGDALTADLGLTSARWQVLGTIAVSEDPLTVPDLARFLGQSRQSIQRLVHELSAEGLVKLVPNPKHKRSLLLSLTKKGCRLNEDVERRRIAWTEGIAAKLSGADPHQAYETLSALRRVLEEQSQFTAARSSIARSGSR